MEVLVDRTVLVDLLERISARLESNPDVSASFVAGYRGALSDVRIAIPVRPDPRNATMLECIRLVSEVRNQQQPGPIFAALNDAMERLEQARRTSLMEKEMGG